MRRSSRIRLDGTPGDSTFAGLSADPAGDVHAFTSLTGCCASQTFGRVIRITGLLQGDPESDDDPLTPQECGRGFSCWLFNYDVATSTLARRWEIWLGMHRLSNAGDQSSSRYLRDLRWPFVRVQGTLQLEAFNPEWVRHYQQGAEFGEDCVMSPECTTGICLSRTDAMGMETSTCSLQCEGDEDCACPTDRSCPLSYHVCVQNRCLPSQGVQCPDMITYAGQYGGADTRVPNGGTLRASPYPVDYDAGIGNIMAAVPPATADGDPPPQTVNIPITRAVVVATAAFSDEEDTAPNQVNFWIADGYGFMEVTVVRGVGGRPQRLFCPDGRGHFVSSDRGGASIFTKTSNHLRCRLG